MSPTHSQRAGTAGKPRRTVRIIKRRRLPRAAVVSLLITGATACVLFAAWRMWRDDTPIDIRQRTVRDVALTWKCEQGHSISARGRAGARPCYACDLPMYPVTVFKCEIHGPVDVMVQFSSDDAGELRVSKHKLARGRWVDEEKDLRCPRCGRQLVRKEADDLAELGRRNDGEGG